MKGKLIYFGDPMCSWCWGIANEIDQLKQAYSNRLGFEMVMGGLRSEGDVSWDEEMKAFLKGHWEHVHQASGQPFNFDLLEKAYFNYDTEPACRAVVVVRAISPENEFDFFRSIQHGFYVENGDPKELEFYRPLCDKLSISFEHFSKLFPSDEYKAKVQEDYGKLPRFGVRGFPSVVLMIDDQQIIITRGYSTFKDMVNKIETYLK